MTALAKRGKGRRVPNPLSENMCRFFVTSRDVVRDQPVGRGMLRTGRNGGFVMPWRSQRVQNLRRLKVCEGEG